MSLVRVWTDLGGRKPVPLVAKIASKTKRGIYTISYLSATDDRDHGRTIYRYEEEQYEIDDDSICEYLNTSDEVDIGYIGVGELSFVKQADSDDDYVPSEEEESEDESDEDEVEDVEEEEENVGED
jgi:hypothetical protein